jgi:hypothetical protein
MSSTCPTCGNSLSQSIGGYHWCTKCGYNDGTLTPAKIDNERVNAVLKALKIVHDDERVNAVLKALKIVHRDTDIVVISPDGQMLAIGGGRWGSARVEVQLWRLPDGVLLKTLIGEFRFEDDRYPDSGWQRCDVNRLAISRNGQTLTCSATFREYDRDYTRDFASKTWRWHLPDGTLL